MYINTRNSTYWYVRVRSVSGYSTQAAFEMSHGNHQNTSKYDVNVFFVVFFFDTYYYIRITQKYVKEYLYDTCQYVLLCSRRAKNPLFKRGHNFARSCTCMYVRARCSTYIRANTCKNMTPFQQGVLARCEHIGTYMHVSATCKCKQIACISYNLHRSIHNLDVEDHVCMHQEASTQFIGQRQPSSFFASASPSTKHNGAHMRQREGSAWSEGKTIAHELM